MKLDDRLSEVLRTMNQNKFTFKTFLVSCFKSDDKRIREFVLKFYKYGGIADVINTWSDNLTAPEHLAEALPAAAAFVVKHAREELKTASLDHKLSLAAKKVTAAKAKGFKLQFVESRLKLTAPTVHALLTGLASTNDTRCATPIISTIASILVFSCSRKANYHQMVTGLYLFSKGASRKLIAVLSKAGMSVSYDTILRGLDSLTKDALLQVKDAAMNAPWYVVYDNINMPFRRHNQRLHNQDSFESGTTATLVVSELFPDPVIDLQPSRHLCIADLIPTREDNAHYGNVCQFHIVEAIQQRITAFQKCATQIPTKKLLPIKRTTTHPLPAMHIDQATITGNGEVIDEIVKEVLELPRTWLTGRMIIFAGDRLTVDRIRLLKAYRWDDISSYHRYDWAIPVIQMFHLQMTLASTILRTHYGTGGTPGSLAYFATKLRRKRVNLDKPDFHATRELLRHCFDALLQQAWEIELQCDDLENFGKDLSEIELNDITKSAGHAILMRYFVADIETINGTISRNAALFLRDAMLFFELSSAIKVGDVGRLECIIKYITVAFQGGSTTNYANELLHLHCGMSYSWTAKAKEAIVSSWLVNTSGREDGWIPADLYQEHNNLLTKNIHAAQGSNASWEYLAGSVSTNIRTFDHIATRFESQYNISYTGIRHADVSAEIDIKMILALIKENGIFSDLQPDEPHITDALPVIDIFERGLHSLTEKDRLKKFKDCSTFFEHCAETDREEDMDRDEDMDHEEDVDREEHMESEEDTESEEDMDREDIEFEIDDFVLASAQLN
ncbi:hypothetical protein BGZ99_001291 [Dissophora globulifera]|uniref:DUF6589 domain-containing protein n=1 Tax=Dissophora globulifera TaxID=979702 RepID=A0A9P6UKA8_9FUNG|nr:hypothetical protein BGZ99_001291 [Dissophora globulifera]